MPTLTIPQALELAIQHHEAGRLVDAETIYRQILAVQPNHSQAHHLLGALAHANGQDEAAVEWIRKAIQLGWNTAAAHSNLGEAYRGLGRLEEAMAAYRAALQIEPDLAAAHYNLGMALKSAGQFGEAVAAFRRAIEVGLDHADAQSNLGACLAKQGQLAAAVAAYRRALRHRPDTSESYFNLGVVLTQHGRLEEAIAAYRRAIQLEPDFAEAHHNLGAALVDHGQPEAAMIALNRALELKRDYAGAHYNLGNALRDLGRLDEAVTAYRRAIELQPGYVAAHNNLGNACKEQGRLNEAVAAFRRAAECSGADAAVQSNLILTLHFLPGLDEGVIAEEQARWNRQFSAPVKRSVRSYANDRDPERRLRIGYVSPDLRDHTLGRNLRPLFRNHDHQRFEILCYAEVARPDQLTEEFRGLTDKWQSTVGVSDDALAEMIRRDGLDILVDLALHTAGNRLPVFAREPAPVQVSFAGYPGSAGVDGIGCRISDGDSAARDRVSLVESFWCYDPCGIEVPVNQLPARTLGTVTFGSLNNFSKINDPVLKLWARVMMEVEDSRLMLLSPEGSPRQWVLETLGKGGVAVDRVEFVEQRPRKE